MTRRAASSSRSGPSMLAFIFFCAASDDKRVLVSGQTATAALEPSPDPIPPLPTLDQPRPFAAPADNKEGGSISQQLPLVEPFAPEPFFLPKEPLPLQSTDPPFIEPAPRVFEPAPRVFEPAPRVFEPETRVFEPAPRVFEPAPRVFEPAQRVFEPVQRVVTRREPPVVLDRGCSLTVELRTTLPPSCDVSCLSRSSLTLTLTAPLPPSAQPPIYLPPPP